MSGGSTGSGRRVYAWIVEESHLLVKRGNRGLIGQFTVELRP